MFGFRGSNTRRKVHSNAKKSGKSGDAGATKSQGRNSNVVNGRSNMTAVTRFAQNSQRQSDPYFDENNSVDMSLYTTQSKATVRYPTRLLNHSYDDDDDDDDDEASSDDDISHTPTEFTTEVALKRYARLGGSSWIPPSPLHHSRSSSSSSPPPAVEATSSSSSPETMKNEGKPASRRQLTPATDPSSISLQGFEDDDNDSMGESSSSETSSVCEATTYSLLPATAKMARFALRDVTSRPPQSTETMSRALFIRNTLSMEANTSSNGGDEEGLPITKNAASPPEQQRRGVVRASGGPVDLDESVADSLSVASSSNSWALSPSGLASPRIYISEGGNNKWNLAESISTGCTSVSPSRRIMSPRETPQQDDDTYGFSSVAESPMSHTTSPPSTRSSAHRESPGILSVSSETDHSWLHRPQESPQHFRDDDTYGFSIKSNAQESVGTAESLGISPSRQVCQVELFKEWEDDEHHKSSSTISKSRAITRPMHPQWSAEESVLDVSSTASPSPLVGTRKGDTNASKKVLLAVPNGVAASPTKASNSKHTAPRTKSVSNSPTKPSKSKQTAVTKGIPQIATEDLDSTAPPISSSPSHSAVGNSKRPQATNQRQPRVEQNSGNDDDSLERAIASSLSKPKSTPRRSKRDKVTPTAKEQQAHRVESPSIVLLQRRPEFPRPPSQTNLSRQSPALIKMEAFAPPSTAASSPNRQPGHSSQELAGPAGTTTQLIPRLVMEGKSGGKQSKALSLEIDRDICGLTVVSALTAPALFEPLDDDTYGFSTTSPAPIPPVGGGSIFRDEEEEGDYVWTDNQGEEQFEPITPPKNVRREILDQTYQETMEAISFARRSNDSQRAMLEEEEEDDDEKLEILNSPGSLLLTESELQKHLSKVEKVQQPLPSSSIEGYDAWKRQVERQKRYFAKLQAKANQRKEYFTVADQRQPAQGHRSSPTVDREQQHIIHPTRAQPNKYSLEEKCMDSTRSAMDQSIDSSIPTIDDGKLKLRRERRRGWGWFQSGRKGEKKKKSKKEKNSNRSKKISSSEEVKKKHHKKQQEPEIVPLSQFMRISSDEPTTVAEFSLAPLHRDGVLTLGTSTIPDGVDSLAATQSHNLEAAGMGPRRMVLHFLEEERDKQRQAELDRSKGAKAEQERIAKRRQEAIEKQRRLHLGAESPNEGRNAQVDQRSVVHKSICVSSKQSVDSSIKSGSGQILSPCVICNAAERNHVAMPCMHFYFCENCVEKLYQSDRPVCCPVCSTADVVFTRVYTG